MIALWPSTGLPELQAARRSQARRGKRRRQGNVRSQDGLPKTVRLKALGALESVVVSEISPCSKSRLTRISGVGGVWCLKGLKGCERGGGKA